MENIVMTPWERVNSELIARKRDWKWLGSELGGLSQPTVNHWEARGIPPKYHHAIEDLLGKSRGWVLDGSDELPQEFSDMAVNLATMLDLIPKSNVLGRSRAYNIASEAIRRELPVEPGTP